MTRNEKLILNSEDYNWYKEYRKQILNLPKDQKFKKKKKRTFHSK